MMYASTVIEAIREAQETSAYVSIQLKHGQRFSGYVKNFGRKGDAIKVVWSGAFSSLIVISEIVSVSAH